MNNKNIDIIEVEQEMLDEFEELLESYDYARGEGPGWSDSVRLQSTYNLAEALNDLSAHYMRKLKG